MKKLLVAFCVILCAVAFTACGASPVATVNGEDITQEEYTKYMDNLMVIYEVNGYELTNDQKISMKDTVIQELIGQKMIEQAAKELDCYPTDDEVDAYFDEQLAATFGDADTGREYIKSMGVDVDVYRYGYLVTLCQENIGIEEVPESTMTDEEAQAIYDEDPESYNTRTVSHILIAPDAGDRETETDDDGNVIYTDEEWAAAEAEAKELIAQLDEGADFAELAQENSDDTASAADGGKLEGAFSKESSSYVEEFTNAAFELTAVGQYTGTPIKTQYGYHIIKVDEMTSSDDMDTILKQIKDDDLETKRSEAIDNYLTAFEADATVVYYDENGKEIVEEDTEAEDTAETEESAADSDSGTDEAAESDAESTDSGE